MAAFYFYTISAIQEGTLAKQKHFWGISAESEVPSVTVRSAV